MFKSVLLIMLCAFSRFGPSRDCTWCVSRSRDCSDRTDLSTESGSGPIQLARDRYRAARRSVADSPPHCMNAQKIVSYYTQSHTRRKERGETEHSVHGAEAESPSISTCHVAAHASGLGERDHRRHTWWASVFRPPWSICGVWTSV